MVDHIKRKIIDLIEGRDADTVSKWLKKFSNLKIVSRDGSGTYRSAIEKSNSNIIQVSDRFHEIKGLSEVLVKHVRRVYSKNIILCNTEKSELELYNFEDEYNKLSDEAQKNYDRKNNEFMQVKEYYNRCNNYLKTAKKFMIDPRTVKEYVHMDYLPILKRRATKQLDSYRNIIIDNIDKKMTDILKILKNNGYKGSYNNLKYYIKSENLKVSTTTKNIFINRTNIIDILNHKGISDLSLTKEEEENLKRYLKMDKKLAKIIEINDDFFINIFSGDTNKLERWIEKAKKINISELNTFISSIEKDMVATKNSIKYQQISNGLIEGKNCKMKMIKRMMYGRCSSNLLRVKLIQLG